MMTKFPFKDRVAPENLRTIIPPTRTNYLTNFVCVGGIVLKRPYVMKRYKADSSEYVNFIIIEMAIPCRDENGDGFWGRVAVVAPRGNQVLLYRRLSKGTLYTSCGVARRYRRPDRLHFKAKGITIMEGSSIIGPVFEGKIENLPPAIGYTVQGHLLQNHFSMSTIFTGNEVEMKGYKNVKLAISSDYRSPTSIRVYDKDRQKNNWKFNRSQMSLVSGTVRSKPGLDEVSICVLQLESMIPLVHGHDNWTGFDDTDGMETFRSGIGQIANFSEYRGNQ